MNGEREWIVQAVNDVLVPASDLALADGGVPLVVVLVWHKGNGELGFAEPINLSADRVLFERRRKVVRDMIKYVPNAYGIMSMSETWCVEGERTKEEMNRYPSLDHAYWEGRRQSLVVYTYASPTLKLFGRRKIDGDEGPGRRAGPLEWAPGGTVVGNFFDLFDPPN